MPLLKVAVRHKEGERLSTRHYSNRQEKSVAKAVGGKQTKNSGATLFEKGDVVSSDFMFECKTRTKSKDSITIKKEWFEQNLNEAYRMGKKYHAVVFNFGPDERNYYVIDENTFLDLTGGNDEKRV